MKALNHLKIQNKCLDCHLRDSSFFCNFSPSTLQRFESIKITHAYPKGTRLFIEGQPTEGIFVLCRGRVKLTTNSRHGKTLVLRVASPGEVLGLSATISQSASESTAQVIEACQVNFVRKSDFLRFLQQNADAGLNALQQMNLQYKKAYMQIRSLGLSTCVGDKLATLFLDWAKDSAGNGPMVNLKNPFSHEEIAEMIGTSRETVTRLLKEFRERELISIKGSDLHIPDRARLAATIGNAKRLRPAARPRRAEDVSGQI